MSKDVDADVENMENLLSQVTNNEQNNDENNENIDSSDEDLCLMFHKTAPFTTDRTQFFLGMLNEDEKVHEYYPKTMGIKRVACELGYEEDVMSIRVDVISPPIDGNNCATVVASTPYGLTASCDVSPNNTDAPFVNHPVATAETRAEGRLLKKILQLNILTAEEMGIDTIGDDKMQSVLKSISSSFTDDSPQKIKETQISFVELLASKKIEGGVNLKALIKEKFGVDNVLELSYEQGQELAKVVSAMQRDKVPEHLQGYEANWRQ